MADRQRWEYKKEEVSWQGRMAGLPIGDLNRLGGDGWEVVAFVPFAVGIVDGGPCGWFLFKRPKT